MTPKKKQLPRGIWNLICTALNEHSLPLLRVFLFSFLHDTLNRNWVPSTCSCALTPAVCLSRGCLRSCTQQRNQPRTMTNLSLAQLAKKMQKRNFPPTQKPTLDAITANGAVKDSSASGRENDTKWQLFAKVVHFLLHRYSQDSVYRKLNNENR